MSTYKLDDGRKLASVTTIISDCTDKSGALTQWAANSAVAWLRQNCRIDNSHPEGPSFRVYEEDLDNARFHFRDISKEARDIGSEVHEAIQNYLKTGKEPHAPSDEVLSAFLAFLEFKDEHQMETEATELIVYGDTWAGTLDWLGLFDGKRTVLDWKTNKNKIYKESYYQIAAYRAAYGEEDYAADSGLIESCGCVRIDKVTGYPEYKCTDKTYDEDLDVFLSMVDLYYKRHPRIRKGARI